MSFTLRPARAEDIPALTALIAASVRELQKLDYSPRQREGALGSVFGVDRRLIEDGTYFVVEERSVIAGCGGWSRRRTLFGSDSWQSREDAFLDPAQDAAKVRAFFVHPNFARRGVASLLLDTCEQAAAQQGFTRLEMGATLTGVPFYKSRGYVEVGQMHAQLPNGERLPLVKMAKAVLPVGT